MHQPKIVAAVVTCLLFVGGCATAADQQHRVNDAQSEADANKADARAESDAKGRDAQSDADVKIADAQAKFAQIREDYRHAMTIKLVAVDEKVSNLEAKQRTLTGSSKTSLGESLTNIRSARTQFSTDYALLDKETATTWDLAKERLDRQFTQLEDLVNGA